MYFEKKNIIFDTLNYRLEPNVEEHSLKLVFQKEANCNQPLKKRLARTLDAIETDCQKHKNIVDENLNTHKVSNDLKCFLNENNIQPKHFYQKILRTSLLSFKNLVDDPHEWSTLNSTFKMYFKRAFIFLNDPIEQKSLISHSRADDSNANDIINEKSNFIFYDISQIIIDDSEDTIKIIDSVIKKLNEFGLNRKILCDAVLGIPLNTLSFFSNKAKNWNDQSDYAKESIMRMNAWLNDLNGVNKLFEWKKLFYTSKH